MSNFTEETEKIYLISASCGHHHSGINITEVSPDDFPNMFGPIRNMIGFFEGEEIKNIPQVFTDINEGVDAELKRRRAISNKKAEVSRSKYDERLLKEAKEWFALLKR